MGYRAAAVVWIVTDVISLFGRFAPVNLAYLCHSLTLFVRLPPASFEIFVGAV